ncbi:MAG: hypothetical protein ACK4SM_06495 [Aquificaceae bacterium]
MNLVVLLLTLLAFFSITLFETALILVLLYYAFLCIKREEIPKGILMPPLLLYAIPTFLSTLFFAPNLIDKGIERSLFLLLYLAGSRVEANENYLHRLNLLLILIGIALIPIVLYRFSTMGEPAPFWGGWFEVGTFYSLFSLSSLSLFLKTRRLKYLMLFFLFISLVFFSGRRSVMLSLGITLVLFFFLIRRFIKIRHMVILWLSFMLIGMTFSYFFMQKDVRFQALYKVFVGDKGLNQETLNTISSVRWNNLKAGIEVIRRDVQQRDLLPLLIGHGINPGERLSVKPAIGSTYESFFFISELIERGLLGIVGILWSFFAYYSFLFRFRVREFLFLPFLLMPSVMFIGSIFTVFWDALLPLYLLYFRMVEKHRKA